MKIFEAIAIPQNHRLFAHFLHEGKIHAFAIDHSEANQHRLTPYRTIQISVPNWEDQFCNVISAIPKSLL
jgi:hypothetical protein